MNTILNNTISITVITLVAGLALGVVQDITAGPIAAQAEKSKEEAYKTVFENAAGFSEYSLDDQGQAEDLVGYLNDNGFSAQTIDEIMVAEDASGETLGYAFTITDSEGYGGDIQFTMGVQNDGTLNGISILSISETAGLGMKATTDDFQNQFKDKNVDKRCERRSLCISVCGRRSRVMKANTPAERLVNGIIKENPTFVLVLGMCPTLAVTTSAINGIGMGLTTTVVLAMSNLMISLLRKFIPDGVRMPAFIVVVASFVTIVQMLLQGFIPSLYSALGIYIPLIVVNCIILGRAEAYASKNPPIPSLFDGIGMGLGFTLSITCIGAVRELLGAGQLFVQQILPLAADGKMGYEPITIFILAPGAFFVLAMLAALQNKFKVGAAKRGIDPSEGCGCCSGCDSCNNTMCKGGKQA